MTISWQEPYDGATSIKGYRIEIATKGSLSYLPEKTYCNAEFDSTVISNLSCSIPMSVLTSAPFNLEQGDAVIARVIAINQIGESDASELSNTHQLAGALVQTAP